jgi:hypothetical protein
VSRCCSGALVNEEVDVVHLRVAEGVLYAGGGAGEEGIPEVVGDVDGCLRGWDLRYGDDAGFRDDSQARAARSMSLHRRGRR